MDSIDRIAHKDRSSSDVKRNCETVYTNSWRRELDQFKIQKFNLVSNMFLLKENKLLQYAFLTLNKHSTYIGINDVEYFIDRLSVHVFLQP